VIQRDAGHVVVRVAAGEPWDGFVAYTVANGWSGVECLSGIPGSAGATPIQNVGAYGQEVAHTIVAVHVVRPGTATGPDDDPDECGFAYRSSVFKHNDRWLVLEVDFRLAVRPTRRRSGTPSWPRHWASNRRAGAARPVPGDGAEAARRQGMVLGPG
jgi:UDP-N-acetylmuramate dehydrogenase